MRPAVSVPTRIRRVHWASQTMQCGASLSAYSWNLQRTAYEPDVTCLVCLYHLGRYMPLSKLREHQMDMHRIGYTVPQPGVTHA